jgi:hypothetical protein
MSQVLRAIPTRYKDILFRSKLEADWAISLDHLGIFWEYEREGRYWGDVFYAPDFWLPEPEQWLEVKGSVYPADLLKWSALLSHWDHQRSEFSQGECRVVLGTTIYHEVFLTPGSPARIPPLVIGLPRGLLQTAETTIATDGLDWEEWPEESDSVITIPQFGFLAHRSPTIVSPAIQKMDWIWNLGRTFPFRGMAVA